MLAVTGATGFVGQMLVDRAVEQGVLLRCLVRRAQPPRAGVEWVLGDLDDAAALAQLCAGARAVLHIAGAVNAPDAQGFERANVTGTAALLQAAQGAGVARFVFVSSLAAREPQLSAYGASKARAEALVAASPLDWVSVRPPSIYGPRDVDNFELFRAAKLGVVPVPAGGRASLIHVEDLVRLLLALAAGGPSHATYEPDDGREGGWRLEDMARAMGRAVGRRALVLGLPAWALMLGARMDSALRGPRARLTRDRAAYMSHPDWVASPSARPPAQLWQPQIATEQGFAATARWYAQQGWL
jgi:nucleoside-diphosphate-sugar epimerase